MAITSGAIAQEKVAPARVAAAGMRKNNPNQPPLNPKQQLRMAALLGRNQAPGREPLKAWEEYAHALLQANEASFVN